MGTDPKEMRAREEGQASEHDRPRSRRPLAGAPVTADEAQRTLAARREHSKGDGNIPAAEPGPQLLDERPQDRSPRDLPKGRDDRSASGSADAHRAALNAAAPKPPRPRTRPTARRSSSAKRDAIRRTGARARPRAGRTASKSRAGTMKRGAGVSRASRGNVPARRMKKSKASRTKEERERASRRAR